jgi:hypothetical protein
LEDRLRAGKSGIPTRIPRSATGQSIGIGQPVSRSAASTTTPRSKTATQAQNQSLAHHTTQTRTRTISASAATALTPRRPSSGISNKLTSTPRSASITTQGSPHADRSERLDKTPTTSRLGVAAHFIPPEDTYTPPKGASWDEVVLPVVAKKLGMGDHVAAETGEWEEGDLAVEWDRDGRAIRWIKGKVKANPGGGANGGSPLDVMNDGPVESVGRSFAVEDVC